MKAIVIVKKNGRCYGYVLSSRKIKTFEEMSQILKSTFEDYEVVFSKARV